MTSASTPPMQKKMSAPTRYMIPMRLWSTVVSHESQPVGRGLMPRVTISGGPTRCVVRGRCGGACSIVAKVSLFLRVRCRAEALLALLGQGDLGGDDVLALVLDPGLVLVDREGDHTCAHVSVVVTTELCALALVDAGLGDLEPGLVGVARRGVGLAAELRDPPRVDDVRGVDLQRDRGVDRHVHVGVRVDRAPRVERLLADVVVAP